VIAVTSGKGGVGKSNISVNLSIALSQLGQKVCLFDADINLANTNILLGLTPSLTLHDFLNDRLDINKILCQGPEGIRIVPAATGIADFINLKRQQQSHMLAALKELERDYDYLIIDTAAGVDETLINFLLAAPYTIVTITPEPTSLTDAFSLLKVLKQRGFNQPVFVIVNMAVSRSLATDAFRRFGGAVAKYLRLKLSYLGYIPSDPKVQEAVRNQEAVLLRHPQTPASRRVQDITGRLKQLMDTRDEHGESGFSAFFGALGCSDPEDTREEAGTPGKAESALGQDWGMKQTMEYLQGVTSDEAVEFLAEAILNWNGNNSDISLAVQQYLVDRSVGMTGDDEPRLSQDQLLQHTVSELEQDVEPTAASQSETHPVGTIERTDEEAGLLDAIQYASLLGIRERSLK
jgi:MinD-like ATPase involved in chromosome partitioning or flagellar assembly